MDLYTGNVPYLSVEQMIEVDRLMIEDYHIELMQMMENAGRNLAHVARARFLADAPQDKRVVILAGTGGNGGGGLVCARRLHNWGATVHAVITRAASDFRSVPAHQLDILQQMGVDVRVAETHHISEPDLIIDAIIGYSLKGAPHGTAADLIHWANEQHAPTLALDMPSGSGHDPTIHATATLTLALPKHGLDSPSVGELYLADISVPPSLYARLNLTVEPIFAKSDIVRLR